MADLWQHVRLEPGAVVDASDGRLGTVDEVIVHPDGRGLAYVVVRRGWSNQQLLVPADLIQAINSPREVHLGVTRDEAQAQANDIPAGALFLARDRGSEVVIPIVVVRKQLMLTEEVRISTRQVTEEQEVREVTRHERLELEDATVHGITGLDAFSQSTVAASSRMDSDEPLAPVDSPEGS